MTKRTRNERAKHYSNVGSYAGAIKINGRWVRAIELNRIDKTGWIRWQGPASPTIIKALKTQPPTQAVDLFPELVIFPIPPKGKGHDQAKPNRNLERRGR